MQRPATSYRIWFTQRSGSTLLCKALSQTGVAGHPGEYFTLMGEEDSLQTKFSADNYTDLRDKLWQAGSSKNGVFGLKYPFHHQRYQAIVAEINALRNMQSDNPEDIVSDLFPHCQHIYLTRRNKIRQVVSWWKAIQDQVWHLEGNARRKQAAAFYAEKYNPDALMHLFKENILMECAVQEYFVQHQIQPMSIVYEDFVQDYEGTIRRLLSFLGLDEHRVDIQAPFYHQTADAHSEEWVNRFRQDLQKNFTEIVY